MQNKNGKQKGPQDHAEGQHGSKTRSKILEQLHSGNGAVQRRPNSGADQKGAARLVDDRQKRDHGEKKSEKNRLNREVGRGKT